MCDLPRTGCAWRTTPCIYVARTSNNRVIMACELYCCLLPQCEALHSCRSGFPIATKWCCDQDVKVVPGSAFTQRACDKERAMQFLCSLARLYLANRGVRQPVQRHTFYAQLLVFDETSAQPDIAVGNCFDAVMSVFYYPVSTRSLIFLQLWTALS